MVATVLLYIANHSLKQVMHIHRTSSHSVRMDKQLSRWLTRRKRIQPVVTDREVSQSCNRKRTEMSMEEEGASAKAYVFAQQLSCHLNHFRKDRLLIFPESPAFINMYIRLLACICSVIHRALCHGGVIRIRNSWRYPYTTQQNSTHGHIMTRY